MNSTAKIVWLLDIHGTLRQYQPVLPNMWRGETDCMVGPFSSRDLAEYFAGHVVDFGQYDTFALRIVPKGNEWYLDVAALSMNAALLMAG